MLHGYCVVLKTKGFEAKYPNTVCGIMRSPQQYSTYLKQF